MTNRLALLALSLGLAASACRAPSARALGDAGPPDGAESQAPGDVDAPDDVSTDDATGRALLRVAPLLGLHGPALWKVSGIRVGFCVRRPPAFPGLVLAAAAVLHEGCRSPVAFFLGRAYSSAELAMPAVLASIGWRIATTEQRKSVALAWASEVAHPRAHVRSAPGECLELGPQWRPPSAEILPTGEVEVQLSVAELHAEYVRHSPTCVRHILRFSSDGKATANAER
jgi:hypothetical protein